MSVQSGAVIFNFEDPIDFYSVINFLEEHPGIKLIYKVMSKDNRLYVVDEERMRRSAWERKR